MINAAHLRAFHVVAEAGSFTGAAARLQLSQPTLSQQVQALEKRYDVTLFHRSGRSIRLTRLGEQVHALTTRSAQVETAIEQLLQDSGNVRSGELRLAASAPVHAIPIFAELERRHPGLDVQLTTGNSEQVVTAVLDRQADLAITADPGDHHGLHAEPLLRNDLIAIVPRSHRLAAATQIAAKEFAGERLVLREPMSMTRRRFTAAMAAAGLSCGEVLTVDSREAVQVAVREGIGIGITASREVPDDPQVVPVSITDLELSMTEYLVCRAELRDRQPVRTALAIAHQVIGDRGLQDTTSPHDGRALRGTARSDELSHHPTTR